MKITRENFEPYFIDFLDGNLPEDQIDQFLDFLEQNPDLKEELHGFENLKVAEEQIVFSGKERLYKNSEEAKSSIEMKMIASIEGDLDEGERKSFEGHLELYPELQKKYQLFVKSRLLPDPSVKFPYKNKLYKKNRPVVILNWVARVAAVVALVWGINALYNEQTDQISSNSQKVTADVTPTKPEPEVKTIESVQVKVEPVVENKLAKEVIAAKSEIKTEKAGVSPEEIAPEPQKTVEREMTALAMIKSQPARLESEAIPNQLAVSRVREVEQNSGTKVLTVEEFLLLQAKKVGEEGVLSAHRIVRAGLGLASELSGDRIGYRELNGKITSLDFESRLIAFSIPLKKE